MARREVIGAVAEAPRRPGTWKPRWPCAWRCGMRSTTLTGRQRAVLVLRVYDDLPEARVARMLNCSVGTVKSAMSRALARLRDDPRLAGFMERETR